MKAIVRYNSYAGNGVYNTQGVYVVKSCCATVEAKHPKTDTPLAFNGYGATYDEAKDNAMEQLNSFLASLNPPDPEIIEL